MICELCKVETMSSKTSQDGLYEEVSFWTKNDLSKITIEDRQVDLKLGCRKTVVSLSTLFKAIADATATGEFELEEADAVLNTLDNTIDELREQVNYFNNPQDFDDPRDQEGVMPESYYTTEEQENQYQEWLNEQTEDYRS